MNVPSESALSEGAPAAEPVLDLRHLARQPPGRRSSIWAGMVLFIVIEATVVVSLVTSYYYFRVIRTMYLDAPRVEERIGPPASLVLSIGITTGGVLFFGILPGVLLDLVVRAVAGFPS